MFMSSSIGLLLLSSESVRSGRIGVVDLLLVLLLLVVGFVARAEVVVDGAETVRVGLEVDLEVVVDVLVLEIGRGGLNGLGGMAWFGF